ncbi:hypothetical protein [Variibacter gotjawalensis]|uniref:hypothetical protein n=1 Tax=Variibacter gotjawalensis TaxID=1333996 RepID=UPI000BBA7842|nr:hypothetical protein [Variibacter gotjawalensis]NIK49744.1 hypothetical protein [Variibacter gotjawalensis]
MQQTPSASDKTSSHESAAGLRAIAENMISLAPTLAKPSADRIIKQAEEYLAIANEREFGAPHSVAAE